MAGNKYLKNASGVITEEASIQSSSGAGDAGKIPALDSSGKLDSTMMPTGVGADTSSIATSEDLSAGNIVNVHDSSGAKVRKADASGGVAKMGVGFVLSSVTSPANATVYKEGTITGLSSLTIGARYYLSGSTAGAITTTAPTTAGHIVQYIGYAISATELVFEPSDPIVLA
jgi:hypothetical protein